MGSERVLLQTYEATWDAVCALHSVQVMSGGNKVLLALQGCDVFELLPPPAKSPAPPRYKQG